jgi:hypothetical protein
MPNTPNTETTVSTDASGPEPTFTQLDLLRAYAINNGTKFIYPDPYTKAEATRLLRRYKAATSGIKPTSAQIHLLRSLARQTGTSFTYPATKAAASAEINRLRALASRTDRRLEAGDLRRERRAISADLAERPHDATAIRTDEIDGWGSTARWT